MRPVCVCVYGPGLGTEGALSEPGQCPPGPWMPTLLRKAILFFKETLLTYSSSNWAGLVAQSVTSATDTLGCTWLVCHRSSHETVDLRLHYAQGCWYAAITIVGNHPYMSVRWENTRLISNDGVAWLGPMQWSWVVVPVGADLRRTDHVQWGRPDSKEVIKQAYPTTLLLNFLVSFL